MTYPSLPAVDEVVGHFVRALRAAERNETPYRTWKLRDVLPESVRTGILTLPVAPPALGKTDGTRDSYNDTRCFFTPAMRADFPVCDLLAEAMQHPEVARQFEETTGIEAEGGFVRIEYIQDLDGAWLEPHRDVPEKLFSMVLYLCTGPEAVNWGTDIYDADVNWISQAKADFNSAVIFISGPDTWHGFEPRPIEGVRRLMEFNYVRDWRDRDQLAAPDRPVSVGRTALTPSAS